ncbi:hypothetical protein SAMN05444285_11226 [Draconibacterium orientale]|uniref:Uncharacterized protein n=1 Tax=Draconibacterium orientale TaxID=1168034 RepID=X5DMV1_9BACT|nr:hypothetical protein [Draconibacterium orientale]AHW61927.1 hypothetical protein FH5T_11205 [Draconibacterium orientale]SET39601.1 hypothetical protein SAMN05444285_11226 [Draconibacterium orientale]
MRALFILLLIYFLTGILQITGDNSFPINDIAFSAETDTIEVECSVSSDIDLCESLLEYQEDNHNKIFAFPVQRATSKTFPESLNSSDKRAITAVFKPILILYTNLPPPAYIA